MCIRTAIGTAQASLITEAETRDTFGSVHCVKQSIIAGTVRAASVPQQEQLTIREPQGQDIVTCLADIPMNGSMNDAFPVTRVAASTLTGSSGVVALSPQFSHSYVHRPDERHNGTDTFDCDGVNIKRIVISGSIHVSSWSVSATATLKDGSKISLGGASCYWGGDLGTNNSTSVTLYPDEKLTPSQMASISRIKFDWLCNNDDYGNATSYVSIVCYGNNINWEND